MRGLRMRISTWDRAPAPCQDPPAQPAPRPFGHIERRGSSGFVPGWRSARDDPEPLWRQECVARIPGLLRLIGAVAQSDRPGFIALMLVIDDICARNDGRLRFAGGAADGMPARLAAWARIWRVEGCAAERQQSQ